MTLNPKLLLILAVLLVLAALFWGSSRNRSQNLPQDRNVATVFATNATQAPPQSSSATGASTEKHLAEAPFGASALLSKSEALLDAYRRPIEFYGKVLDEIEQPVSDAIVQLRWADATPEGGPSMQLISDNDGLFTLTGVRGMRLTVQVRKEGYHTAPSNRFAFEYYNSQDQEFYTADAKNPVVFRLRRNGQFESLIYGRQLFRFRSDGTAQYLDLLEKRNQLTPQGDLAVRFTRGERLTGGTFDWSVSLSAVADGGLRESGEGFMFLAPDEGYKSTIEIERKEIDPDWTSRVTKKLFLRSRGGKLYGRLEATIIPRYQEGSAIDLRYYLNTNGSRNLEYDETVPQSRR